MPGHQIQRVQRRLERLEKKQEPRRLKAEQRLRPLSQSQVVCQNAWLRFHFLLVFHLQIYKFTKVQLVHRGGRAKKGKIRSEWR